MNARNRQALERAMKTLMRSERGVRILDTLNKNREAFVSLDQGNQDATVVLVSLLVSDWAATVDVLEVAS